MQKTPWHDFPTRVKLCLLGMGFLAITILLERFWLREGTWLAWVVIPAGATAAIGLNLVIWRWQRSTDWKRTGRCPTCGYDLRASPERCPECGSEVTKPKAGHE